MSMEDIRVTEIEANTRLAETRQSARVAEAYLAALRNRNLTAIGQVLHPQFSYVTPAGETHGTATFLATLQQAFNNAQKIEVKPQYASGNQTAYVYNMFFAPSPDPVSTVNVLTHQDGLIKKIEEIGDKKFSPEHFKPENTDRSSNPRTA